MNAEGGRFLFPYIVDEFVAAFSVTSEDGMHRLVSDPSARLKGNNNVYDVATCSYWLEHKVWAKGVTPYCGVELCVHPDHLVLAGEEGGEKFDEVFVALVESSATSMAALYKEAVRRGLVKPSKHYL